MKGKEKSRNPKITRVLNFIAVVLIVFSVIIRNLYLSLCTKYKCICTNLSYSVHCDRYQYVGIRGMNGRILKNIEALSKLI